jgi:hypothetical protein
MHGSIRDENSEKETTGVKATDYQLIAGNI